MELKVVSVFFTCQAPVPVAGALFAFANTEPWLLTDSLPQAIPSHLSSLRLLGSLGCMLDFFCIAWLFAGRPALCRTPSLALCPPFCVAYHSQSISIALHTAIARQIPFFLPSKVRSLA
eukprot:6197789-Pleurochrysis_carterae.AAC.2